MDEDLWIHFIIKIMQGLVEKLEQEGIRLPVLRCLIQQLHHVGGVGGFE